MRDSSPGSSTGQRQAGQIGEPKRWSRKIVQQAAMNTQRNIYKLILLPFLILLSALIVTDIYYTIYVLLFSMLVVVLLSVNERAILLLYFVTSLLWIGTYLNRGERMYMELGAIKVAIFEGILPFSLVFLGLFKLGIDKINTVVKKHISQFVIFFAICIMSLFYTTNWSKGVIQFFYYLYPLLICVIAYSFVKKSDGLSKVLKLMVLINIIVLIFDSINAITFQRFGLTGGGGLLAYNSVIENRTTGGYFYAFMASLTLLRYLAEKRKVLIILFVANSLFLVIGAVRAPLVFLIVTILIFAAFSGIRASRKVRTLTASIVLLLILIVLLPITPRYIREGLPNIHLSGREAIWPRMIKSGLTTPILGKGLGSSATFLTRYGPLLGTKAGTPHSEYVSLFYELGLAGLLALIIPLLLILRRLIYIRSDAHSVETKEASLMSIGFISGLLAVMVADSVFHFNIYFIQYGFAFVGLALKLGDMEAKAHLGES